MGLRNSSPIFREKNDLPVHAWKYSAPGPIRKATLDCDRFGMVIDNFFGPDRGTDYRILLTDEKTSQDLEKLTKQKWIEQKSAETKKKAEFKL